MARNWFTEEDLSGTLLVEHRDGSWFVAEPGEAGETKYILDDSVHIGEEQPRQQIEVGIKSFRQGVGKSSNSLMLTAPGRASQGFHDEAETTENQN